MCYFDLFFFFNLLIMPGIQYKGFAQKLATDPLFARKLLVFNLVWLLLLSFIIIWMNQGDTPKIPRAILCQETEIQWEEFLKHSCETEDLWIVIDGHVYNMWPWGK